MDKRQCLFVMINENLFHIWGRNQDLFLAELANYQWRTAGSASCYCPSWWRCGQSKCNISDVRYLCWTPYANSMSWIGFSRTEWLYIDNVFVLKPSIVRLILWVLALTESSSTRVMAIENVNTSTVLGHWLDRQDDKVSPSSAGKIFIGHQITHLCYSLSRTRLFFNANRLSERK